jgi:hypothetical protein
MPAGRSASIPAPILAATLLASLALLAGCELNVKPGATSIFQAFAEPTPEEAAVWAIDQVDANNRYRGTLILSSQPFAGEPLYLRLFADNIKDADPGVRAVSARALGNHGKAEHAALLVEALKDRDVLVRREAARALQRLHAPEAAPVLIVASREPDLDNPNVPSEVDGEVRAEAARALGQFAEDRVVQALIAALGDSRLAVNVAAQSSLRTLTGQDFGLNRRDWLDWYGESKAAFAARGVYTFPVFYRERWWYEYLPFVPPPPSDPTGTPLGLPLPGPR